MPVKENNSIKADVWLKGEGGEEKKKKKAASLGF